MNLIFWVHFIYHVTKLSQETGHTLPQIHCLMISTKMNLIEEWGNSNGETAGENSTWMVSDITDVHLKDVNGSTSLVASNWNPSRSSPLFHTACALLLASYLAPTYSRSEPFTCTLREDQVLWEAFAVEERTVCWKDLFWKGCRLAKSKISLSEENDLSFFFQREGGGDFI